MVLLVGRRKGARVRLLLKTRECVVSPDAEYTFRDVGGRKELLDLLQ